MTTRNRPRPIRLAFSALFWRLLIGFGLILETLFGLTIVKRVPPSHWLIALVLWSPPVLGLAFALATGLTLLVSLAVSLIVRPRMLAWQSPKVDASAALFHLEPRETIVVETPARMADGRRWPVGRLVQTDRRILFLPDSWETETWSARGDRGLICRAVESPNVFWGLIRNLPDRLEIETEGEPSRLFALDGAREWAVQSNDGHPATKTLSTRSF